MFWKRLRGVEGSRPGNQRSCFPAASNAPTADPRTSLRSVDHLGIEVALKQDQPSTGRLHELPEHSRRVHLGGVGTRCEDAGHGELRPTLLALDVRLDLPFSEERERNRPPPVTDFDADLDRPS